VTDQRRNAEIAEDAETARRNLLFFPANSTISAFLKLISIPGERGTSVPCFTEKPEIDIFGSPV